MAVVGVELRRAAAGRLVTLALPRYWQARLEVLLRGLPVLPFDASAAVAYRRIIAQCGWARRRDYDRITAAHAISSRSIFVTNNLADFSDIPGLSVGNWVV